MKKSRKILIFILLTLSFVVLIGFIVFFAETLDDVRLDERKLPGEASMRMYDKEDALMDNTGYITSEDISQYIKNAFIAVEDKRFYEHNGVDLYRIVGAAIQNFKKGEIAQGGSTISNQLIKNTHLSGEKTIKRKIQEAKITLELERKYSKDQILEMYLNVIYFGKGIYGVGDACRIIYGVLPKDVTPLQAASLAATVANPARYSVLLNKAENQKRSRLILSLMKGQGRLSETEYNDAIGEDIAINYSEFYNNYGNIYNNSALFAAKEILKNSFKSGYKVYTYFDPEAQAAAEYALSSYSVEENTAYTKEIVVVENLSGGVSAYASNDSHSAELRRQPGSLLKPFIYAKAIEGGNLLPDTPVKDAACDFDGYSPTNYGNTYYGWISVRDALSRSVNTVAVGTLDKIGIEGGYRAIEDAGIKLNQRDKHLSLALGGTTYGSTCLEIAQGYATLANQGTRKKLSFIRKIEDNEGNLIFEAKKSDHYALSRESVYLTTEMMMTCAKEGTAKQLKYLPYDVAAKTGTVAATKGNSDAWCAAYTANNTFVCRYSADPEHPFPDSVTGGNLPTKAIRATMNKLYTEDIPQGFATPPLIRKVDIDKSIKEVFHKLVPHKNSGYGERESILTTVNYSFDAPDPERMLIGDLHIMIAEEKPIIAFQRYPDIQYEVKINGIKCLETAGVYQAEKQRFPIGKLEIYCLKDGRSIWKTTRLVRLY